MIEQVRVIGCGIIGLTTAITLQRQLGIPVQIMARDLPPHTTSNIAAAVWLPFQVAPIRQAIRWATATRKVLESQTNDVDSGVFTVELFDLLAPGQADPYWVAAVESFRHAGPAELPAGYEHAVVSRVPMIDTPVYMSWLLDKFRSAGGEICQTEVQDLTHVAAAEVLLVNCTGLGARTLCSDSAMFPIRGQIARLAVSGFPRALTVEQGPDAVAYLLPRRGELIAGGTTQRGDWNEQVDAGTAAEILGKAAGLDPALAGAEVIEHVVGLRPGRESVRLQRDPRPETRIIHNYGHGGAGFTLAWGCAEEVARLAVQVGSGGGCGPV